MATNYVTWSISKRPEKAASWEEILETFARWEILKDDTLLKAGDTVVKYAEWDKGVAFRFEEGAQNAVQIYEVDGLTESAQFADLIFRTCPQLVFCDKPLPLGLLETAYRGLLNRTDGWDSREDLNRLFTLSSELWRQQVQEYDRRWINLAEIAHNFSFTMLPDEETGKYVPMYEAMGYEIWGQFARDVLGIPPPSASQLKWVWEVYVKRLGYTVDKLRAIGKSKLVLTLKEMRVATETDPPNKARVEQLERIMREDSFSAALDQLRADRGKSRVITFQREAREDYDQVLEWFGPSEVRRWLEGLGYRIDPPPNQTELEAPSTNPSNMPYIGHVSVWLDNMKVENGMVLLFKSTIGPDDMAGVTEKIGKALRWDKRGDESPDVSGTLEEADLEEF